MVCAALLTPAALAAEPDDDSADQDADAGDTQDTEAPAEEPSAEAPPASPPPRVIQLAPTAPIPTALDELDELASEATDPRLKDFWQAALEVRREQRTTPIRGAWFARPRLALGWSAPPDSRFRPGFTAGAVLGHRWWPVRQPRTVDWGGETTLQLEGHLGGLRGATVVLSSVAGPWVGPVGLTVGPRADVTRYVVRDSVVPTAVALGGQLNLAVDTGPVMAWVGMAPLWSLAKERGDGAGPLPTIGTETDWTAGVAIDLGVLQPRLHGNLRTTAAGPVGTVGLGLQFTPDLGQAAEPEEEP